MPVACNHKKGNVPITDKNGKTRCDECYRHTFTDDGFGNYFCYQCGLVDDKRISYVYSNCTENYNIFRKVTTNPSKKFKKIRGILNKKLTKIWKKRGLIP